MTRVYGGRDILLRIVPVLILLLAFGSDALAQFDPFNEEGGWPPEVEVIPPEGDFASGSVVEIRFKVVAEEGIHIYRDEIAVDLEEGGGVSFKEMILPEGRSIPDIVNPGQFIDVLEGTFEVRALFDVTAAGGGAVDLKGTLSLQGCTDAICHPPHDEAFELTARPASRDGGAPAKAAASSMWDVLKLILGGFIAGVLLSLTPCVFPLIPVTSAIIMTFSKGGGKVSAFVSSCIYVLGVAVTYSIIGVIVAFAGGAIQSTLNSSPVRWTIAAVYLALGVSMFGLFDMAMPSAFSSKLQQRSANMKRNYIGLLGMGMISGLIVGPCVTAPLVYFLIEIAKTNSVVIGFGAMFALSWGMGLLIIVAGTFTGLIPKAGPWMEWFKKLFGFILLGGALYTAMPEISEAVFNYAGAVLLVFASVFLGGLDSLSPEAGAALRVKKVMGVLCLLGALVLCLSNLDRAEKEEVPLTSAGMNEEGFTLGGSKELAAARQGDKPVVLYFTADWCTLCKGLKKNIFSKPEAKAALQEVEAIMVDVDQSKDLVKKYDVLGPPTIIFFDRKGNEKRELRANNFDSVEDFVTHLKKL